MLAGVVLAPISMLLMLAAVRETPTSAYRMVRMPQFDYKVIIILLQAG